MNSGPAAGLAEIRLPKLQAGSSIMPGKVNPVIPEAVAMVCVQVIGLDTAVAFAAQETRFQLCTMLPLIGANLLEQIRLLDRAARVLAEKAIAGFEVNRPRLEQTVARNAMLVTALAPRIGYDASAKIAQRALAEDRTILEVAREETDIPEGSSAVFWIPRSWRDSSRRGTGTAERKQSSQSPRGLSGPVPVGLRHRCAAPGPGGGAIRFP